MLIAGKVDEAMVGEKGRISCLKRVGENRGDKSPRSRLRNESGGEFILELAARANICLSLLLMMLAAVEAL